MGETSELYDTPLRGVLYALMELEKNVDGEDVLNHLMLNYTGYHGQRERVVEIAGYLAGKLEAMRPDGGERGAGAEGFGEESADVGLSRGRRSGDAQPERHRIK